MAAADSLTAAPGADRRRGLRAAAKRALRARRRGRIGLIFVIMTVVAVVMLYPFWYMLNNAFRNESQFEQQQRPLRGELGPAVQRAAGRPGTAQLHRDLPGVDRAHPGRVHHGRASRSPSSATGAAALVFLAVVAALMVPLQSIIIPEYVNLGKLGLINTYLGAILVYVALGTPFATFLMATYYRGISDDLIEAAVMDGLGYERTFLRIALPLSWPAIATVTVLQFIQIWDDLLVGLLFLQNPQQRTITVGLAALSAGRTSSIPVLMAGSFISAVPAIVVYLIFQRYLVRGLTLGMGK